MRGRSIDPNRPEYQLAGWGGRTEADRRSGSDCAGASCPCLTLQFCADSGRQATGSTRDERRCRRVPSIPPARNATPAATAGRGEPLAATVTSRRSWPARSPQADGRSARTSQAACRCHPSISPLPKPEPTRAAVNRTTTRRSRSAKRVQGRLDRQRRDQVKRSRGGRGPRGCSGLGVVAVILGRNGEVIPDRIRRRARRPGRGHGARAW